MVKRIAPIRVISFFLLAACGALCQSERPSADLLQKLQFDGSNSLEVQRQQMRMWRSLPDAPSVQPPTQAVNPHTFVDEVRSPLTLGAVGISAGVTSETELGHVTPGPQPSLAVLCRVMFIQKRSNAFLGKYLYPSLLKQDPHYYYPSTSGTFVGRASYAVSRIFITRDDSGKGRLNTSYFLGVLTSVAIHNAYRPYWARSTSATFNNFGSTIGSDAGMNVFHEFGTGIRQMVKGHTPKFVLRIEEHITHDQTPRDVATTIAN